jgi:cob(I)alamin adenosyltransferase
MKIYTKRGDQGETSLFGNVATSKASLRVAAYGELDELNACLGVARALGTQGGPQPDGELDAILAGLQSTLFDVGAELATPPGVTSKASVPVDPSEVTLLESIIDRLTPKLPVQKNFVLPGGSPSAALLHHARTVSRRAERAAVALAKTEPVSATLLVYLNRLSDLLFVLARVANLRAGVEDVPWIARRPSNG